MVHSSHSRLFVFFVLQAASIARLWVHEMYRVIADRLVDEADLQCFQTWVMETVKSSLGMDWASVSQQSFKHSHVLAVLVSLCV